MLPPNFELFAASFIYLTASFLVQICLCLSLPHTGTRPSLLGAQIDYHFENDVWCVQTSRGHLFLIFLPVNRVRHSRIEQNLEIASVQFEKK
jgi:hypothetical protein